MNRADHAEKQLRVMQQLDEDHTLTQLANAWIDLVMVGTEFPMHGSHTHFRVSVQPLLLSEETSSGFFSTAHHDYLPYFSGWGWLQDPRSAPHLPGLVREVPGDLHDS